MDSRLYEELCREFVAREFGLPLEAVTSPRIPNPQRPDMPKYAHQVDLYWEISNKVALYLHIANAKWRGSGKVKEGDVLLLQQVRQKVAAHKALMITTQGFDPGAIAAAMDDGIGLHIVNPNFAYAAIPTDDRTTMRAALSEIGDDLYTHEVVHRGLEAGECPRTVPPTPRPSPGYTTRQVTNYTDRAGPGPGATNRSLGGGGSSRGSGIITRDGFTRGGGDFRQR